MCDMHYLVTLCDIDKSATQVRFREKGWVGQCRKWVAAVVSAIGSRQRDPFRATQLQIAFGGSAGAPTSTSVDATQLQKTTQNAQWATTRSWCDKLHHF